MNNISAAFQKAATAVATVPHLNVGLATLVTAAAALFAFKVIGLAALLATLVASLSVGAMSIYAKPNQEPPLVQDSEQSTIDAQDTLSRSASEEELEPGASALQSAASNPSNETNTGGIFSRLFARQN